MDNLSIEYLKTLFEYRDGHLYRLITISSNAKRGDRAGTIDKSGYVIIRVNRKHYKEHRLIFLMHHGYLPEQIDHIDGTKDNNRIENLRPATNSQNQFNKTKRTKNNSGLKGVHWNKSKNKYISQCSVNGTKHYLGQFDDKYVAYETVCNFRKLYHGEFCNNE